MTQCIAYDITSISSYSNYGYNRDDETINGKIFVTFISLILKSTIDSKIKNIPVKKVINELEKIKIQKLSNGSEYISPLAKKQKEIIKKFDIAENELKETRNNYLCRKSLSFFVCVYFLKNSG